MVRPRICVTMLATASVVCVLLLPGDRGAAYDMTVAPKQIISPFPSDISSLPWREASTNSPYAPGSLAHGHSASTDNAPYDVARPDVTATVKPQGRTAERTLITDLQTALTRAGCYHGRTHGKWTAETADAMRAFVRAANAVLPHDRPDYILLALMQNHADRTCASQPEPGPSTVVATRSANRGQPRTTAEHNALPQPALMRTAASSPIEPSETSIERRISITTSALHPTLPAKNPMTTSARHAALSREVQPGDTTSGQPAAKAPRTRPVRRALRRKVRRTGARRHQRVARVQARRRASRIRVARKRRFSATRFFTQLHGW
ncbi:MAG: hypothetical protein AAF732_11135 [Pseudomonadota bacterium]